MFGCFLKTYQVKEKPHWASKEAKRDYYLKNRERLKAKAKEYYEDNREVCNARNMDRYYRAKEIGPTQLCACGCGEEAKPNRKYIHGHGNRGREFGEEVRAKISKAKSNMSEDTKRKMSANRKGKCCGQDNYRWSGGTSLIYGQEWGSIRKEIEERDNHQCMNPECKRDHVRLSVHHIDYDVKNCHPHNLITLCVSCHGRTNENRDYWMNFYAGIINSLPHNM